MRHKVVREMIKGRREGLPVHFRNWKTHVRTHRRSRQRYYFGVVGSSGSCLSISYTGVYMFGMYIDYAYNLMRLSIIGITMRRLTVHTPCLAHEHIDLYNGARSVSLRDSVYDARSYLPDLRRARSSFSHRIYHISG